MSKPNRFPRTMPWYRSRVIMSGLAVLIAAGLKQSGVPQEAIGQWTDWALLVIVTLAGGTAIHSRVAQDTAPKITGRDRS